MGRDENEKVRLGKESNKEMTSDIDRRVRLLSGVTGHTGHQVACMVTAYVYL